MTSLCYAIDITPDMSDSDLQGIITTVIQHIGNAKAQGSKVSFKLFSSSWDQDSRALWEIDEAKQLFRKIISKGWYGVFPLVDELGLASDNHQGAVNFESWISPILFAYGDAKGVEQNRAAQIAQTSVGLFNSLYASQILELRAVKKADQPEHIVVESPSVLERDYNSYAMMDDSISPIPDDVCGICREELERHLWKCNS